MSSLVTVGDVIEEAKGYLLGNDREETNALADYEDTTGADSGAGMGFSYPLGGIRKNAEVELNLEVIYVTDVNQSAQTISWVDGFKGSPTGVHAAGTLATVNPRFYRFRMLNDLNAELDSLSSPQAGLFAIGTADLTYISATRGYTINASNIIDVLELWAAAASGVTGDWRLVRKYKLIRSLPTAGTGGLADGAGIMIDYAVSSGYPLRVIYKKPFTAVSNASLTTALSTTGLPSTAYDLLAMGIAIRQNAGREISRNTADSQPDPRRAAEVPPGAVMNSSRALQAKYQQRLQEEVARLHSQYPMRTKRLDV